MSKNRSPRTAGKRSVNPAIRNWPGDFLAAMKNELDHVEYFRKTLKAFGVEDGKLPRSINQVCVLVGASPGTPIPLLRDLVWAWGVNRPAVSTPAVPAAPAPVEIVNRDGETYKVTAVLEMLRISNPTLNRYAKLAGVNTPDRGKRNHVYNKGDLLNILETIVSKGDRKTRERCKAILERMRQGWANQNKIKDQK